MARTNFSTNQAGDKGRPTESDQAKAPDDGKAMNANHKPRGPVSTRQKRQAQGNQQQEEATPPAPDVCGKSRLCPQQRSPQKHEYHPGFPAGRDRHRQKAKRKNFGDQRKRCNQGQTNSATRVRLRSLREVLWRKFAAVNPRRSRQLSKRRDRGPLGPGGEINATGGALASSAKNTSPMWFPNSGRPTQIERVFDTVLTVGVSGDPQPDPCWLQNFQLLSCRLRATRHSVKLCPCSIVYSFFLADFLLHRRATSALVFGYYFAV